jgi:hypothetical protein
LTASADAPDGRYAYLRFAGNVAELRGAARIIAARVAAGVPASEIAVLVRSNLDHWTAVLEPLLSELGLTLATTKWVTDVLCESEVRRGIAIGHLALERTDSLSWWGLLRMAQGCGPTFVDYVYDQAQGGEAFGQALLRLKEAGFPGSPAAARAAVGRMIDEILGVVDALAIEHAELDVRGWGGWLVDRLDIAKPNPECRPTPRRGRPRS